MLNPLQPVASGGFTGSGDLIEDFTAATAGATYRDDDWSVTGRAEYRDGERDNRYGVTAAALKQIGEGSALGASFDWFTAKTVGGAETRATSLQLSWAHRPADSRWSWLEKLELRDDRVAGATAGQPGPLGAFFTIAGDARSRRVVNSLSVNFSEKSRPGGRGYEISLFWGSRYASERLETYDVAGGAMPSAPTPVRPRRGDRHRRRRYRPAWTWRGPLSWSAGPSLGFTPVENSWISVGWNLTGFRDRDFEEARYTAPARTCTFASSSIKGVSQGWDCAADERLSDHCRYSLAPWHASVRAPPFHQANVDRAGVDDVAWRISGRGPGVASKPQLRKARSRRPMAIISTRPFPTGRSSTLRRRKPSRSTLFALGRVTPAIQLRRLPEAGSSIST